jgi:hypothetical protein
MSNSVIDRQSASAEEYPYGRHEPVLPRDAGLPPRWLQVPRNWLVPAVLAAYCAAGNFAILPLTYAFNQSDWGAFWVYVSAGAIVAQAGLLACFFVFADPPFWRRLVGCYSAAIVLWGCWELGAVWHHFLQYGKAFMTGYPDFAAGVQFCGLSLPLLAVAIYSPLWFFRAYLSWRLRRTGAFDKTPRPFSIHDYFVGTSVVAASLMLARIAPQREWVNPMFWQTWAIVFGWVAGVSLISVIPAMLLTFRCGNWWLSYVGLIAYGLFAGVITIVGMAIYDSGFRTSLDRWVVFGLLMVFATFAAFLGAGMKAARNLGYELVIGHSCEVKSFSAADSCYRCSSDPVPEQRARQGRP